MPDKFKSTINGGIPLCRATNLAGAVQPMIPELKRGATTYLRESNGGGVTVTFTGFPAEAVAHNVIGEPVDLPDWGHKALRMLEY